MWVIFGDVECEFEGTTLVHACKRMDKEGSVAKKRKQKDVSLAIQKALPTNCSVMVTA